MLGDEEEEEEEEEDDDDDAAAVVGTDAEVGATLVERTPDVGLEVLGAALDDVVADEVARTWHR